MKWIVFFVCLMACVQPVTTWIEDFPTSQPRLLNTILVIEGERTPQQPPWNQPSSKLICYIPVTPYMAQKTNHSVLKVLDIDLLSS
ncbi:hypothetical protein TcasGA2_TC032045 [Tribolium castaneum]|uniref:Uncharacterized protein n=1 Tax=Tribolium castaneum TaxID=7070 RepID=A0A139WM19_TRICA|nr:hypothetical protein TcasGA2_TC032045 [Tribolium castaneum]